MNEKLTKTAKLVHRLPWPLFVAVPLFVLFAWGSASLLLKQERLKVIETAGQVIVAKMDQDADRLHKAFSVAENAAWFLASLPTVDGIGRALASGGNDPLVGTSLEVLRRLLEQIGSAYTVSHPEIFQIRLIGLADNGRELVRIIRDAEGKVSVAVDGDLQSKADRLYFTEALRMPEGAVYFSPIDLNIEHGQIERPLRPTLRAALSVRNARGEVFGVVVVNLLAQPLLDAIRISGPPDVQEYLTDAAGHYVLHPQPGKAFSHLLAPPEGTWREEFTAMPGVPKARDIAPAVEQSAMRAPDGTDLLVFTRTLRQKDTAGAGGLVLHAAIPLAVLDARAWEGIRQDLLLVWGEGLLAFGLLVFMLLRWRGMKLDLSVKTLDEAPGRTLRLFGLEIPFTPAGRRPHWLTLVAALLPVPFWAVATLLLDEPLEHPFIGMLIPVLLAVWWGGLYSGLGATLLAVLGSWDLAAHHPLLDSSAIGEPLHVLGVTTLLVVGLLFTFMQENVRQRAAQLLAQQRSQRETEQRLVAQAPAALAMFDMEMSYLACSTRWKTMHGFAADLDLIGRSQYEVMPEIPETWRVVIRRVLAGETLSAHEDRFERADGRVQWVNWECKPWRAPGGVIGGLILWADDITDIVEERRAAESAQRESESKFRDLWESNRDAQVLCFPSNWKFTNGNAAAVALFAARDQGHLASFSPVDLSPERQPGGELSSSKAPRIIEEALREGAAFFEWTHRRLDGREVPCEILLTRVMLKGLVGVQATIRDVTLRKEAEAARDELLAGTNDLIQRVGLGGVILYVNDAWCRTLGYSRTEASTLNIFQVIHPKCAAHCRAILGNLRENGSPIEVAVDYVTKDGRILSLEGETALWRDREGTLSTRGIFRDVTMRKEAEAARRELDRMRIEALEHTQDLERRILRASEWEQQRIGRDLHDSLGPHLAAIGYAAAFLANEVRKRDPKVAVMAERLREMTGEAVSLTRDLSRGICPVQTDAAGLSSALEALARTTSDLTGMSVSYYETGHPQVTDSEEGIHLYRIAQEALNNALKHSGGRMFSIALHQSEDALRLAVADDGKGMIPPANGSRGMGLESMRFRAHVLGGDLKIDSNPGEGTIISCEIPHRQPKLESLAP